MLDIGQVFQSKYKIEKVLGQGGMGKVYLASHITLSNKWAIKETKKSSGVDLLAEPAMLRKLNNPNIPKIIDIFEDEEYLYIVEDYIEGISLSDVIEGQKIIEENQVISWAVELCDILAYLHNIKPSPIIYRDLKPENIMISEDNKVKLIDFGIAREYKEHKTEDTQNLGSLGYKDVYEGQSDEKTDIFSLGVTMHQMLTGVNPRMHIYENEPVRRINPKLSPGIEKIVAKCTDKNREKRFRSADDLKKALLNIEYINSEEYKAVRKKKIRITAFCIILFICLGIVGIAFKIETNNKSFNSFISKGNDYLIQMDYKNAEEEVSKALKYDSKNVKAYELLASIYNAQGDYDGILKAVDQCKKNNVKLSEKISIYYGGAIFDKGNFKGARGIYENVLQLNKSNIEAKANLAVCYAKENEYAKANEILNGLKNGEIDKYFISSTEGEILYSQGQFAKAEESLKTALQLRPQEFKVLLSLSEALLNQKKYKEEIEILNKAESVAPNNLRVLDELAECNFYLGSNDKSEAAKSEYFKKSLDYYLQKEKLGDKSSDNIRKMGIVQMAMGKNDEAINLFEKVISVNPKDTTALRQLGSIYADKKDYTKAKTFFNKVLETAASGDDYDYAKKWINELPNN